MTRKEFIQKSLLMGIGWPLLHRLFPSPEAQAGFVPKKPFEGKIVIVGAGAAGMAAGYLLKRYGIDFEILEAAPLYGGRLKKTTDLADFPIDLGAEWIHVHPRILTEIVKKPSVDGVFETIVYNPKKIQSWNKGRLRKHGYLRAFYSEWKFKRSTWFDFFEQSIVPAISAEIRLNSPVTAIQYAADGVTLRTADGIKVEADKVLLTPSVKLFQKKYIHFSPALPEEKTAALDKVFMGDGIKLFVLFKEKFYPDILSFGNVFKALRTEEKFVYDAAFKKDSEAAVLGLFAINEKAKAYTSLPNEAAVLRQFLAELDEMFEGKASANYQKHVLQNWSAEPFVQGAYSYSFEGEQEAIVAALAADVDGKLYFAGEALSIGDQAMVQGACASAYAAVAKMLGRD